jgi:hypothetical protein
MEHSSRDKYVVAFNRARDFYQVPLALCEIELLSSLVTDCYYPNDQPLLRRLPGVSSLKHRYASGLPSSLVHWTMRRSCLKSHLASPIAIGICHFR